MITTTCTRNGRKVPPPGSKRHWNNRPPPNLIATAKANRTCIKRVFLTGDPPLQNTPQAPNHFRHTPL